MNHMVLYSIPVGDKFILYRPLLRLAFVGNRAMASLVQRLARGGGPGEGPPIPEEIHVFLESIGFFQPDPPEPAQDHAFRPTTGVLLLTNRCNLRCAYCYASGGEGAPQSLTVELARLVIDQVCQNAQEQERTYFELTFHGGGEPLQAWEVLRAAAEYARAKPLPARIGVVSNGVWTLAQRDWLMRNLDEITISFDGTQRTQDAQRPFPNGRGSYRAVMSTLQALDASGRRYGIRLTATPPFREKLAEDVRFLCEHTGCRTMQVEPAFHLERGGHIGPGESDAQDFAEAFIAAVEVARQAGRELVYSGARPWLVSASFCSAPYGTALSVTPEGQLVTCYEIVNTAHPMAEMSTIGQVEEGRFEVDEGRRERFLAYLDARRAGCRECFCFFHCAGDCYTRSASRLETPTERPASRCAINQAITRDLLLLNIQDGGGVWRGNLQGGN
jgi:uncharacterized protein